MHTPPSLNRILPNQCLWLVDGLPLVMGDNSLSEEESVAIDGSFRRDPHISVSQAAEATPRGSTSPRFLAWIESPFQVSDPATGELLSEVSGWAMSSAGRGPLNQVGGYVGNAILRLALLEAGCSLPREQCDGTVYGLKPSSLLTATSAIVGVLAAILMPLIGAIVDHTSFRRLLGSVSGFLVVAFTASQLIIGSDTWFIVLVLDGLQSFTLVVQMMAVFAYLPDLTTDEASLSHFTAHFNLRQFAMQITYVAILLIVGTIRDLEPGLVGTSVQNAKDAIGLAFGISALFVGYSWIYLFRSRPPLRQLPAGQSLFTAGFLQMYKTAGTVLRKYRALKWFMFSLLWSPEAGAGVVNSIAVTFLTISIQFTAKDLVQSILVLQSGTLAGSLFSKFAVSKVNPLNSYRLGLLLIALSVGAGALYIDSPDKRAAVFGLGLLWGFALGWTFPSQRVLLCTLIPKGQETEMMGFFAFVGQILGWLLPLAFTILNENDIDIRWGFSLITFFCCFAVVCTLPMGNYEMAVKFAARESEEQRIRVLEATYRHHEPSIQSQVRHEDEA